MFLHSKLLIESTIIDYIYDEKFETFELSHSGRFTVQCVETHCI